MSPGGRGWSPASGADSEGVPRGLGLCGATRDKPTSGPPLAGGGASEGTGGQTERQTVESG